jgi:hypothetical protein
MEIKNIGKRRGFELIQWVFSLKDAKSYIEKYS